MMMSKAGTKKTGNRPEFILLIMVFVAPFLAAWLIYNFTDIGRTRDTTNYGVLITPPRTIADLNLGRQGNGASGGRLHGKWSLIYLLSGTCASQCQDRIHMLRNLRLALGSNSDRLQIVVAAEQPYLSGADLDGAYVIDPADIRAAEEGKAVDADYISGLGQGFYLVDPAGNLMMRYFVDSEGAGILQDLKRLLRYSRIG